MHVPGRAGVVILCLAFPLAFPLAAQRGAPPLPPRDVGPVMATGTAGIGGVVVDDETPAKPVRRAKLSLRDVDRGFVRAAISGDDGRFVFRGLSAGHFLLSASKAAYVSAAYGAATPRGQGLTLTLTDSETLDTLRVTLPRGGVISGTVTDEAGRPLQGVRLAVLRRRPGPLSDYELTASGGSPSDERGHYRIYGLPAGAYIVGTRFLGGLLQSTPHLPSDEEIRWAMRPLTVGPAGATGVPPPKGPGLKQVTVYHPNAVDPALAAAVDVVAGEETPNVDIVVRAVPTASLRGVLSRADGQPLTGVQVVVARDAQTPDLRLGLPVFGRVAPDGTYSADGLEPGHYLVSVRAPSVATPGSGARGSAHADRGPPPKWTSTVRI